MENDTRQATMPRLLPILFLALPLLAAPPPLFSDLPGAHQETPPAPDFSRFGGTSSRQGGWQGRRILPMTLAAAGNLLRSYLQRHGYRLEHTTNNPGAVRKMELSLWSNGHEQLMTLLSAQDIAITRLTWGTLQNAK